jgi:hypothetical protein
MTRENPQAKRWGLRRVHPHDRWSPRDRWSALASGAFAEQIVPVPVQKVRGEGARKIIALAGRAGVQARRRRCRDGDDVPERRMAARIYEM